MFTFFTKIYGNIIMQYILNDLLYFHHILVYLLFLYSVKHSKKHKANRYKMVQGVPKIKLR